MALHALVAAHAALQYRRHPVGRNAGAVVLDDERQTRPPVRRALALLHGQQHATVGPFEGVFEQVAEQLLQVAGLAVEARGRVDLELAHRALGGVDLLQAAHDLLGMRLDLDRRGKQLVTAGGRARQLVGHQIGHALQLRFHFLAQLGLAGAGIEPRTQHRERRLQAVREIRHRVALPGEMLALALDQRVDALGQRLQLTRMLHAHAIGLAALHAHQLVLDPAQGPQTPAHDQRLQQQQDHTGDAEVHPQRGAEHPHLARHDARILHDVDGVRELAVGPPFRRPHQADAVAIDLARRAVAAHHRQRAVEAFFPGTEHRGLGQLLAGRRPRIPAIVRQHHLGVQPAAGPQEAIVGR